MTAGPSAAGGLFVCVYNDQQHFAYLDADRNIQDCWYDGSGRWNLQQINNGGMTAGPSAAGGLFVCVYNDQQHFAYLDADRNIQDCWYDGSGRWNLQQINNANGSGATVPDRYVATPQATAPAAAGLFVCVYNNQQHFAYLDPGGNIQDCWYDGSGRWNLQQINNANGSGATVPDRYVATPQATAPAAAGLFVCVYNNQQHFAYLDASGNIWDSWWGVPEMSVRVVEVLLPNKTVALVQAADLDGGGYYAEKVGRKDIFDSADVSRTLDGIAQAVLSGLEKVTPSKTTVELGIQLALKNGKLTGLVVEGKAEASLTVTFEWDRSSQPMAPPPDAQPNR